MAELAVELVEGWRGRRECTADATATTPPAGPNAGEEEEGRDRELLI